MSHPSIFELRHFAVSGALDEGHVAHVSTCASCSERLQRLARGELRARGVEFEVAGGGLAASHPAAARAIPAFLFMTATMLVLSLIRPAVHFSVNDPSSLEPEGVHGIPYPHVVEPAPLLVDGGAQLRGE